MPSTVDVCWKGSVLGVGLSPISIWLAAAGAEVSLEEVRSVTCMTSSVSPVSPLSCLEGDCISSSFEVVASLKQTNSLSYI